MDEPEVLPEDVLPVVVIVVVPVLLAVLALEVLEGVVYVCGVGVDKLLHRVKDVDVVAGAGPGPASARSKVFVLVKYGGGRLTSGKFLKEQILLKSITSAKWSL